MGGNAEGQNSCCDYTGDLSDTLIRGLEDAVESANEERIMNPRSSIGHCLESWLVASGGRRQNDRHDHHRGLMTNEGTEPIGAFSRPEVWADAGSFDADNKSAALSVARPVSRLAAARFRVIVGRSLQKRQVCLCRGEKRKIVYAEFSPWKLRAKSEGNGETS